MGKGVRAPFLFVRLREHRVASRFIKLFDEAPDIEAASSDAKDRVPLRGRKFCGPLNAASSVGWYIFPPIDFYLNWDGHNFFALFDGLEDWTMIDRVYLPGYIDRFEAEAPEFAHPCAPSFLDVFPEPGVIQIWTGYVIRSDPDLSSWVRSPINIPHSPTYDVVEGIIETDWWFGAMIVNLRFKKTDTPVHFSRITPLCQVFNVPRSVYDKANNSDFAIENGIAALSDGDWQEFYRHSNRQFTSKQGSYIHEAKRQRDRG